MALPPLYKYLDVQGAKLTLGNRKFKHAKPSDFNDTEDLTIQSIFPEDAETALTKLANSFTDEGLRFLRAELPGILATRTDVLSPRKRPRCCSAHPPASNSQRTGALTWR
jgi:hypothetical protein